MRTLVLLGSGEFTPNLLETDRYIIEKQRKILGRDPKIAIIPTAAGRELHPEKWVHDAKRHFAKLDLEVEGLMILNRDDSQKLENAWKLDNYDIFYFSGGHPGYLLDTLIDTPFWNKIMRKYEEGKVLAGSSAGAMIMGNFLIKNAEEVFELGQDPIWTKGFGLLPYSILPHFDLISENLGALLDSTEQEYRNQILGIEEDTAIILNDEKEGKIFGNGKVLLLTNIAESIGYAGEKIII